MPTEPRKMVKFLNSLLCYGMKTCNKCRRNLSLDLFSINNTKRDGHNATCKECQRVYAKSHYLLKKDYYIAKGKRNRKLFYQENLRKINDYKSRHSCKYCPENDPCCLDLHHRESARKEYTISNQLANLSWLTLEKEIQKCDVVCSNCHRKLHAGKISV